MGQLFRISYVPLAALKKLLIALELIQAIKMGSGTNAKIVAISKRDSNMKLILILERVKVFVPPKTI